MSRGADSDFLGRWSARKLKAREPGPEPQPDSERAENAPATEPVSDAPEKTDDEILRELGLPDPDSLGKGDDFKAFLKSGVPGRIRNRALRRLWVSDPVLANLDGLNDYDQDFTDAATVMKDLKTAYTVGRGFLREETTAALPEQMPEQASEPPSAEPERLAAAETAPTEPEMADPQTEMQPDAAHDSVTEEAADEVLSDGPDAAPRPDRMQFRFGG